MIALEAQLGSSAVRRESDVTVRNGGGWRREIQEDLFARRGAGCGEGRYPHIDAAVDAYRPAAVGSVKKDRVSCIACHVMLLSRMKLRAHT